MAEKTTEEIRDEFMDYVWCLIEYWDRDVEGDDQRQKLEGICHSLLCAISGMSAGLPPFTLAVDVGSQSQEECESEGEGEDWYPNNDDAIAKLKGDISAGVMLHKLMYDKKHRRGQ